MLSLDLIDSPCLPAVLAALQFWLGLVLPTVLLARMQCRQYVAAEGAPAAAPGGRELGVWPP